MPILLDPWSLLCGKENSNDYGGALAHEAPSAQNYVETTGSVLLLFSVQRTKFSYAISEKVRVDRQFCPGICS